MIKFSVITVSALFLFACSTSGPLNKGDNIKGISQASPAIYTNDTTNLEVFKQRVAFAKSKTSAFFGRPASNPAYVFCDTEVCDGKFTLRTKAGPGPRAKTVGAQLIVIGTQGRDQMTITHEQVHADLHARFSLIEVLRGDIPAWFDEGLAGYISEDDRLIDFQNLVNARYVMSARTASQFASMIKTKSWQHAYGAGRSLVADIDQRLGRAGLLSLIDRVAAGSDFNTELVRVLGPKWPQ
jgi:hypothetical protein